MKSDNANLYKIFAVNIIIKYLLFFVLGLSFWARDSYIHALETPLQFMAGDWMPPRDRTPLFSLMMYGFGILFNSTISRDMIYLVHIFASTLYLIPLYFIAKKIYGDNIVTLTLIIVSIIPFTINNLLISILTPFDAFFVLSAIYLLFFTETRSYTYLLSGFLLSVAFLIHNQNLIYVLTIFLIFVYKRISLRDSAYFLGSAFLTVLPYLIWVYSYYGTIFISRFMYYPFSVTGYNLALYGTPEQVFTAFHNASWLEIIKIRVINIIATWTPAIMPLNSFAYRFETYEPINYWLYSLPGNLTIAVYLFALLALRKVDKILLAIIILPFLFNFLIFGWVTWGIIRTIPSIILLVMLAVSEASKYKYAVPIMIVLILIEDIIYLSLR